MVGLGGVGKSELALQYAFGRRLDYALVWWIDADSRPSQAETFGPEHPSTLAVRANLARWTGEAGDAPPPAPCTPSCCRSANAS